ncbi:hypothetical protein [Psychrobacter sp. van23A]|uniref:hypothetical protein n=1 Tax=Psychrobacter sp. van23A TaxID=3064892 RepID=UPI0027BA4101|nr:hypothetical protein [Psychrobacter sp. van23A]WLW65218.1 hypothetical protein RAH45_07025 [Psychrobacter sp. van23A]
MKLASLLVLIPLSLMSVSAMANVSEVKGKTQCTVIDSISKKKATKSACTYTGAIGGSMSYGIEQLNFKLKNGKKYSTVNDATFDFGEDGRVKNLVEEVSFNGKSGELVHIRMKTFKVVSETAMDKLREAESAELDNGILKCFRAIKNKDTAFCTPIVMD